MDTVRSEFVRPLATAIAFTFLGEMVILIVWGLFLFPAGDLGTKAIWTGTCGLGMGATVGALVNLVVTGRLSGARAGWASGMLFFAVTGYCALLCYSLDIALGSHFGAHEAPMLFIAGGLLPAFLGAIAYGWLLYSKTGTALFSRLGRA